jgi:putative methionine-R-sulfoxide reductase with GAF domain
MSKSEQREFHGIVSAETDKLISIVENLLNFLRMEDESRIIRKSVINMNDVLRELLASKSISAILSRKGIQLNLETQDSLFDVVGDKVRAAQLFTNLIDGFSYHLERGDTIRIASSNNDHVTITISLSRALPDSILTILHNARYIFHIDHPENRFKFYLAKSIADTHRWKLLAQNNDNACDIILMIPRSTKEAIDTYVDRSMDYFVEFISELLDLDICSIMLSDELTNELTVKSAIGLDDDIVRRTRIKFGDSIAGWVALEGKPLFIKNIEDDPRFSKKSISQYTTKSLMSLPLKIGDRVIGVLNLNNKKTSEPFTQRDYSIASLLSEKIASYLELLYSEKFNEEKIRRFIASLSSLATIDKVDRTKSDLLSGLTDKILKSSPPLK